MSRRRRNRAGRGTTLVEGLISTSVLIVGIMGAFQGIFFASQQNAVAGRLARATAMAIQIRQGLEGHGRARILASNGPLGTACVTPTAAHLALTDGLTSATDLPTGTCVVDLDLYDYGAPLTDRVIANHDLAVDYDAVTPANSLYRRVLVVLPTPGMTTIAVVVSTKSVVGRRIFVKQFLGLYDPTPTTGNGGGVDL